MSSNPYKVVTDQIIERLKAGVVPWRQPWSERAATGGSYPRNAITGRAYSGVNVLLLWSQAQVHGYEKPMWLTYKQAKEHGGHVRQGEKGTQICFLSSFEVDDASSPTGKRRASFLRLYTVFNIAQCDGLAIMSGRPRIRNPGARDETVDAFVAATGASVVYGGSRACFRPFDDHIEMPVFEAFKSADAFYSTEFHELTHWTGGKSRLDRKFGRAFGDESYTAEELVAELGAAFLCSEFSIDNVEDNAAYIQSWIKYLSDHERAIVSAASMASKAVEFLRGKVIAEEEDEAA